MQATGMFFLTRQPALVVLDSPDHGPVKAWQFATLERTKRGVQAVVAVWKGTEAANFVQAHARYLKRGCALNLSLERVRPYPKGDGLCADVLTCALAPERWPAYDAEPRIDSPQQPRPLPA